MTTVAREKLLQRKIANLEGRFERGVKQLFPPSFRPIIDSFFWQRIAARDALRNAETPLLGLERIARAFERKFLKEFFRLNPEVTLEDRARIKTEVARNGQYKLLKALRPKINQLKKKFAGELVQIDPRMALPPDGGAAIDQLERIRDSLVSVWPRKFMWSGQQGSIRQRFVEDALFALPERLRVRFLNLCTHPRLFNKLKAFRPYIEEPEYRYITELTLLNARYLREVDKDFHEALFESVPLAKRAYAQAYARRDDEFFARLHEIRKSSKVQKDLDIGGNPMDFLLKHWAEPVGDVPALYNVSIKKLIGVYQQHAGHCQESVEKVRRRLGLPTLRKGNLHWPTENENVVLEIMARVKDRIRRSSTTQ
jgi:hypothetical protein